MHNDPNVAQIQRFYSSIQLKLSSTSNPSLQKSFSEFGMTIGGPAVSSTPVHIELAPLNWFMHAKEYGNGGEVTNVGRDRTDSVFILVDALEQPLREAQHCSD